MEILGELWLIRELRSCSNFTIKKNLPNSSYKREICIFLHARRPYKSFGLAEGFKQRRGREVRVRAGGYKLFVGSIHFLII